jgi:hypothetical protein
MAWKFANRESSGAVIDHWEIEKVFMDVHQGRLEISYQGWLNQAERLAGSKPLVNRNVAITYDLSTPNALNFIKMCEGLVKSIIFPDAISYLNDIIVTPPTNGSWKVTDFNYDDVEKKVNVHYSGHRSVDDQMNGLPTISDICTYSPDESPNLFTSLINYAKARVRSEPMFTHPKVEE